MSENEPEPGADFDAIVRSYRSVRAPSDLAEKIRAQSKMPRQATFPWPLSLAAVVSVMAVVLLTKQFWMPAQNTLYVSAGLPSFSSVAALKMQKPATVSISLSRVRSLPTPALPSKPVLLKKTTPQSRPLPAMDDA